jgi:hypothetical protein
LIPTINNQILKIIKRKTHPPPTAIVKLVYQLILLVMMKIDSIEKMQYIIKKGKKIIVSIPIKI